MGVPENILIPFMGIDFDGTQAFEGPATVPINALFIGQMLSTGTATAGQKYVVFSADEVSVLAGSGSVAHRMAIKAFANRTTVPFTFIFLDDAASATAASIVLTITGTATKTGELDLYYNGIRIAVSVAVDDTPTIVGDAIVTAVGELEGFPATVANVAGAVTFTAKNKGVAAGDIDLRDSYNAKEAVPDGLTLSYGAITAGSLDPDVQTAISAIGDDWFNVVGHIFTDSTNIGKIKTYASGQDVSTVMKDQIWYAMLRDTRSNLITYGLDTTNHNSKHLATGAWYKRPNATYEGAAAVAAAYAQSLQDAIERPLHRIGLQGILALDKDDIWTDTERNQLAASGIQTFTDGTGVATESTVTMYLKNSSGVSDDTYQFCNTVYNLMAQRYRFRVQILTRYPQALLVTDGDKIRPGISFISISKGRSEALIWYRQLVRDGLAEDYDAFKKNLVVQRSETNQNRIEWLLPSDIANQFIVGSADIQFKL